MEGHPRYYKSAISSRNQLHDSFVVPCTVLHLPNEANLLR
ncbi:hypothetical protein TELCIR_23384 [Teladorsagia circumcincta]|uniref:Uncharacterized protein n=1 Tax=Teladorsagia circumcincta TaxID=45464 RepID=A0A2G9TCX2_TELCI|nr:hypothetical protein TELCIR_23384 [Teladorsagia circumcincta]